MLRLTKETLTELTPDQLADVVGGDALVRSCVVASCITGRPVIHLTMNPTAVTTTVE